MSESSCQFRCKTHKSKSVHSETLLDQRMMRFVRYGLYGVFVSKTDIYFGVTVGIMSVDPI